MEHFTPLLSRTFPIKRAGRVDSNDLISNVNGST